MTLKPRHIIRQLDRLNRVCLTLCAIKLNRNFDESNTVDCGSAQPWRRWPTPGRTRLMIINTPTATSKTRIGRRHTQTETEQETGTCCMRVGRAEPSRAERYSMQQALTD